MPVGATDRALRLADGRQLQARVWGCEGPSMVVFCHGAAESRMLGPAHAEDLEGSAHGLITFDRPGYGGSDRQRGRSLSRSVDDLRQLLDGLGVERCIVAGWSAGAAFALAAAAHLRDRVDAVRLVAPLAPIDSEVGTSQLDSGQSGRLSMLSRLPLNHAQLSRVVLFSIRGEAQRRRADPEGFVQRMAERSSADRAALADPAVRAVLVASTRTALADSASGWADDVSAVITPWGIDLSTVTQPVQLWHGTEDPDIRPVAARWFAERLPGATLTELHGQGHLALFGLWPQLLAPITFG